MSNRQNISSGAPWEATTGYSRAVRIGNIVEVSGTVAVVDGKVAAIGDAGEQARVALQIILKALAEAGAKPEDVIRTRMMVTDISQWEAVAAAHAEVFRDIRPATTMVEVKGYVDPEMLVEIEVSAVIS